MLVWAVFVAVGCSHFNVRTHHDPSADLGRVRTFAWLPPNEADPADQRVLDRAIDRRLRAAVDRELGAKGLKPVAERPDVLVNYRLSTTPDSDLRGRGYGRLGGTPGPWGTWAGGENLYVEHYDAGALYLALVDPTTRRMVWVGAAEARILPHVSLEKTLERVDAAVHAIISRFPE